MIKKDLGMLEIQACMKNRYPFLLLDVIFLNTIFLLTLSAPIQFCIKLLVIIFSKLQYTTIYKNYKTTL